MRKKGEDKDTEPRKRWRQAAPGVVLTRQGCPQAPEVGRDREGMLPSWGWGFSRRHSLLRVREAGKAKAKMLAGPGPQGGLSSWIKTATFCCFNSHCIGICYSNPKNLAQRQLRRIRRKYILIRMNSKWKLPRRTIEKTPCTKGHERRGEGNIPGS